MSSSLCQTFLGAWGLAQRTFSLSLDFEALWYFDGCGWVLMNILSMESESSLSSSEPCLLSWRRMSQQATPHRIQTKERARKNQIVVYFSPQRRRSCQLLGLRQRSVATVDESEGAKEEGKVVMLVCYNRRRYSSRLEDGVHRQHVWRNVWFSRSQGSRADACWIWTVHVGFW